MVMVVAPPFSRLAGTYFWFGKMAGRMMNELGPAFISGSILHW